MSFALMWRAGSLASRFVQSADNYLAVAMPPPLDPAARAEALRVLVALGSGTPHLQAPEALELGLPRLTERDLAALELASGADLKLANACLIAEYELRERAYAALERLLAYANMEDGGLDERLHALPLPPFADATTCLYELGWIDAE